MNQNIKTEASQKTLNILEKGEYKKNIENSNDMVNVFTMFIIIGFIVQYLFNTKSSDGSNGQATAEIWSYGIMLLSLICILVFSQAIPSDFGKSPGFAALLPLLLLFIAFFWAISIRIKYYKQINKEEAPRNYYLWSNITNILHLGEALLIILGIKVSFNQLLNPVKLNSNDSNNFINLAGNQESMKFAFGNFIIVFILFIMLGIQQVILDSFMVSG